MHRRDHAATAGPELLRIIVLGYVVRGPLGGMVWSDLHYLMGLANLGHDVYFLEDSDDYESCYDPETNEVTTDASYGLRFAARVFDRIGLKGRWAYFDAHTDTWHGPCSDSVPVLGASADLLLNLAGVNPLREWLQDVPVRVLIDQDPAFTQIRHLSDRSARERASRHTAFATFAENVGSPGCGVPNDGFPWVPTRQPVVMDTLTVTPGPTDGKFTSVMQWESYPPREHEGVVYGMKADSFRPYLALPRRVGPIFELAVGGEPAELKDNGWIVRDPRPSTRDPWTYEAFIRSSKAEFGVAKHGYVVTRSGWFSERSTAYMASGRPAVIQDTGFSDWLEVGSGVMPFSTFEEAAAAIEEVTSRYERHCRAARSLVEAYFDARIVLPALLERVMNSSR